MEAISLISHILRVKSSIFHYAGTKDRRAVTSQLVTAFRWAIRTCVVIALGIFVLVHCMSFSKYCLLTEFQPRSWPLLINLARTSMLATSGLFSLRFCLDCVLPTVCLCFRYVPDQLRLGDLTGNRFSLVLRYVWLIFHCVPTWFEYVLGRCLVRMVC